MPPSSGCSLSRRRVGQSCFGNEVYSHCNTMLVFRAKPGDSAIVSFAQLIGHLHKLAIANKPLQRYDQSAKKEE